MAFQYVVEERTALADVAVFLDDCVDVERFLPFCRQCHNGGARWSCPPFSFDPMEMWRRYDRLRLYVRLLRPTVQGQTMAAALAALKKEKALYFEKLLMWESQTPGSMLLAAGTCDICPVCARETKQPCRHPDRLRYSIEALGGDVEKCARQYFDLPVVWAKDEMVPAYLMLVGGLLMR